MIGDAGTLLTTPGKSAGTGADFAAFPPELSLTLQALMLKQNAIAVPATRKRYLFTKTSPLCNDAAPLRTAGLQVQAGPTTVVLPAPRSSCALRNRGSTSTERLRADFVRTFSHWSWCACPLWEEHHRLS